MRTVPSTRKLAALRALAERPGTKAEGEVAREMLQRLEAKQTPAEQVYAQFGDFLRSGSMDDLRRAVGEELCGCGNRYPAFAECPLTQHHEAVASEIRERFPRGTLVYYNCWAYSKNCTGIVSGYPREWNWLRIKFDHLKTVRSVPVYCNGLWHLSSAPVDDETLRRTGVRGGMDDLEEHARRFAEQILRDGRNA